MDALVNFNIPRRCNMAEDLSFYDVKTKKKFTTSEYRIEDKGGRKFAVTKSQEGSHECWRVVSKDFAAANGG
tara:strand:- start:232 stop:447 length:216 start_codon:yes stop_codon:yes gene_type:complete